MDRGRHHCENDARSLEHDLEARILGAIESQILVPDHVAYIVERTMERPRDAQPEAHAIEKRVAQISKQIERLMKLAEASGDFEEIGSRIAMLGVERDALVASAPAEVPEINPEALRPLIENKLADLRIGLAGVPDKTREALRVLFGGERLLVTTDRAGGFSVNGTARLSLDIADVHRHGQSGGPIRPIAYGPESGHPADALQRLRRRRLASFSGSCSAGPRPQRRIEARFALATGSMPNMANINIEEY